MNRKDRRKHAVSRQLDRDAAAVQTESLPRTIAVEEFAQARLREISILKSALDNKVGGNKRAGQDLPRHLRRRASSHNVYRLPARLRARAKTEMEKQTMKPANKPKRRERRRPSRMMQDYERRARLHVWLETHLWHAKRMHMDNVWRHRLAVRPTDKGQRATYKAALHFATLYDASSYTCVQIDGPVHVITSYLQPFLPDPISISAADEYRCRNVMMYEKGEFPSGALGPCDFLWNPPNGTDQRSLWIWIHPAIADYVSNMIMECFASTQAVTARKVDLVRFELLGSRCQSILNTCLRPAPSCSELKSKMWSMLSAIRSQSALPRGVCLGLDVIDPRSFSTAQQVKISYPDGADNRVRHPDPCFEDFISDWSADLSSSSLWSDQDRERATASLSNSDNVDVPVVLIQRQLSSTSAYKMSGWDLIVPKGWAMPFWKSLIFAGCRAIGLADRRNIYLEQGAPHFPEDFPGTAACALQAAFKAKLQSEKHGRTPKAKRANFESNAITSPFQPDWSQIIDCSKPMICADDVTELGVVEAESIHPGIQVIRGWIDFDKLPDRFCLSKTLVRVCIEMRWGGVPTDNALVYASTDDDRRCAEANNWPGLELSEIGRNRPVIAIVNAGGFSFSAGSGIGYGYASVMALQERQSDSPTIVLLRNTTSKHFHLAVLRMTN